MFNKKAAVAIVQAVDVKTRLEVLERELEACKQLIRAQAQALAKRRDDESLVSLDSPAGVATVCFVRPGVRIVKGANVLELRERLTEFQWDDLFTVSVGPSQGFDVVYDNLPTAARKVVGPYVEWVARQPRVTLPKQPAG